MKKSVVSALLGLGLAAVSTTAFGQGGIIIGNYQGAYNAVVWGPGSPRAGLGVLISEGVQLQLWYGEGTLTEGALTGLDTHIALPWSAVNEGNGFPGFYANTLVTLPQWNAGDTYTFQIRATGGASQPPSNSALWFELANIANIGATPPGPPGLSSQSIGFTVNVPEPTTFALAGLGAAAMMIFRRRSV